MTLTEVKETTNINTTNENEKDLIKNYILSQSYQKDFKDFMTSMLEKYGVDIFNLNGIGTQLDLNRAIKKMMSSSTMADASVDPNSNTNIVTSGAVLTETCKAHSLMHNHYRVWKFMKKSHDLEYANDLMERKLSGQLYIHDFSTFLPYSYFGKTTIVVKHANKIIYTTMEDLFKKHENRAVFKQDMFVIDFEKGEYEILDMENKFVPLERVMKHKSHCDMLKIETKDGRTTIVTEDHPVILENGEEKKAVNIVKGDKIAIEDLSINIKDNNTFVPLAYMGGFTLGDGYVNKNYSICIVQKDFENKKIGKLVQELYPNYKKYPKGNNTYNISIHSTDLCKNKYFQFGKYAFNKFLPEDILEWDKGEILSFIAGVIDSDGCINPKNGLVDIRITSFTAVQQIADILRNLGFQRVRTSFVDKNSNAGFESRLPLYRVSFVATEELCSMSEKISAKKDLALRERQKDGRFETNEVLKLLPHKEEYVYDVTTETGTFYSQGMIQHNCFNFDPIHFALLGIPKELDGKGESLPPQHLESFFGILQDILPIFAKNLAGACGIATLFPVISIYMKKHIQEGFKIDGVQLASEEDLWRELKVKLTSLLYNLNRPSRDGSQSLFSNVSIMSPSFLEEICKDMSITFKNGMTINADVDLTLKIQDLWVDVFNEESERRLFTFPVQTLSVATEEQPDGTQKIKDIDFYNHMMKKNMKFGAMNVYAGDSSTLSSCCRLRSDKSKVFTNSLGGSSSNIGSFGVCTVNLATLGLRYKDDIEKFYLELDKNIEYAQEVNRCKMSFIKKDIKKGSLPMYTLGFVSLDKQYATLGINGLYECCKELGYDIRTPKGEEFVKPLLTHINNINDTCGEKMKHIVNVEQVPAENVAVKLASIDRILNLNSEYNIYANQFIPLDVATEGGILERIGIQGKLDQYFSGGSILHVNLDQECKDENLFLELGKNAIEKGVRYFGINYVTCCCHDCGGTFVGHLDKCPHCQSEDFEKWCRVVGYMIPIDNYNKTRRQEFGDRVFYNSLTTV